MHAQGRRPYLSRPFLSYQEDPGRCASKGNRKGYASPKAACIKERIPIKQASKGLTKGTH
eukprot:872598-Pelagomonas_calceolata.AAC.1